MFASILAFIEGSKKTIYIVLAAIAALYVVASVSYYLWSQSEIQQLVSDKATLAIEKSQLSAANDALTVDAQNLRRNTDRLNTELEDARETARRLSAQITRKDWGALAQKNPGKVEEQINKGISDFNKRLMELTR